MSTGGGSTSDAANSIAILKRRRATIKAACTRIENFAAGINVVDDATMVQLRERRKKLDNYWSEYNSIQTRLEDLDESEGRDRETFENAYYDLCATIAGFGEPRVQASPAPSAEGSSGSGSAGARNNVRLPKLNIPAFNGKYDKWLPYRDLFSSAVHSNSTLSRVEKLQYLKGTLEDEALGVIDALEVSEANYDAAWDLINERYNNERAIAYAHIKAIMGFPPIIKESAVEIRNMCDSVSRHLLSLKALKRDSDKWDDVLVYWLSTKLDAVTAREWHASLKNSELPTMKMFKDFLAHRSRVLESLPKREITSQKREDSRAVTRAESRRQALHATAGASGCSYCGGDHSVYTCRDFVGLSVVQRIAEIKKRGLCLNCLRSASHRAAQCPSGSCRICKGKHNSLLHLPRGSNEGSGSSAGEQGSAAGASRSVSGEATALVARKGAGRGTSEVLLSTAVIYIFDKKNSRKTIRVLLDSGSQANFITAGAAKALCLPCRSVNLTIAGVGKLTSQSTRVARVRIRSRTSAFEAEIECVVTDHITGRIPTVSLRREKIKLPPGIQLADPQFYRADAIDMLIGAELFLDLVCVGRIRATQDHPVIQKTRLGWVLAGRSADTRGAPTGACALHAVISNAELHDGLKRFWELEEVAETSRGTADERMCEQHFLENVQIGRDGRYTVKIPVRPGALALLGESREIAMRRLFGLEKRFRRDAQFRDAYARFIQDYERLGHMRKIDSRERDMPGSLYLPHHGVLKKSEAGVKLRVVFDASCRTSGGRSLNEALLTGPTIQQELASLLIRFRTWRYVFTADIIKMYRQILVDASQTKLQRILWCGSECEAIQEYELLTVTYGTTSAPFLATRVLKHLAESHESEFPVGAKRITRDFYMDDLLTGADTLDEAIIMRDQIIAILRRGKLELSKWLSNHVELLPREEQGGGELSVLAGEGEL
ncbi:uncharacterized protein [Cardiocondyla obscurior]|uniref:uncharacterized protein n=1 Tax=Cardiocondyla obscurior TaxID=286306 RepID=UPI00396584EC